MSYLDLLCKLYEDVESDVIPENIKREILNCIFEIECMIWPYSD